MKKLSTMVVHANEGRLAALLNEEMAVKKRVTVLVGCFAASTGRW